MKQTQSPIYIYICITQIQGERERHTHREMRAGTAEIMLQRVFDGSTAEFHMEIKRRPYHRSCTCALHRLKDFCYNPCSRHKFISFTKKKSWNECSLYLEASSLSSLAFLTGSLNRNREVENKVDQQKN